MTAYVDLEHGQWTTGLHDVISVLQGAHTLLKDCKAIGPDVLSLEAWATNLATQTDLEAYIRANVTRHLLALTNDLRKARGFYKDQQYWQFGLELGVMASIATN